MTDTTALEAAAFRRLLAHLRERSDVQNIDLMIQAGFCRNCLSNWLQEAAEAAGTPMDKDAARLVTSNTRFWVVRARVTMAAGTAELVAWYRQHQPSTA